MPTTTTWNIDYPNSASAITPLESHFEALAVSTDEALTAAVSDVTADYIAADTVALNAAKAYADSKTATVLASGTWNSSASFGSSITTTGYRQLVISITTTTFASGFVGHGVSFTGLTSYDAVIATFGSTALTNTTAQSTLSTDGAAAGNMHVIEVDYPGTATKKTILSRGNLKFTNARSTNAGIITAFNASPNGSTGASGTYEVIGIK